MSYLPNSDGDRREMLERLSLGSTDDLFSVVPDVLRGPRIDLPPPLSEQELVAQITRDVEATRAATRPV